jgi:hypothetical protein
LGLVGALRKTGEFVTVWQSDGQDGSGWGIFGEMKSMVNLAENHIFHLAYQPINR